MERYYAPVGICEVWLHHKARELIAVSRRAYVLLVIFDLIIIVDFLFEGWRILEFQLIEILAVFSFRLLFI